MLTYTGRWTGLGVFRNIQFERGLSLNRLYSPWHHPFIGVGQGRRPLDHNRSADLLGELKGEPGEIQSLLRGRRHQHGRPCQTRIVPGVLLDHAVVYVGIVGDVEDQPPRGAAVLHGNKAISSHIES